MRSSVYFLLILSCSGVSGWTADTAAPAKSAPTFTLPDTDEQKNSSRFSDAQIGFVQSWIRQKAPECPVDGTATVAENFLQELQDRHPEVLDHLLESDFPAQDYESTLLRYVGAQLPSTTAAREAVARRRLELVQKRAGAGGSGAEATVLMGKIKDQSAVYYRQLLEGRLEEDELQLVIAKSTRTALVAAPSAPVAPKEFSASDIVSEFVRHNQAGSAWQRLRAYTVEGRLKTAEGEEVSLLLFKMRPDRFRLVVQANHVTRYIIAATENRFWQQADGQSPHTVAPAAMGPSRYLVEFSDPLFAEEGYHFERLPDGVVNAKKVYRIAVQRGDGSKYVAGIDAESWRFVARENEDKTTAHYSDFREVAGIAFAFREESTDHEGRTAVFQLTRVTPNPGLIQDLFEPPVPSEPGYFRVEQMLAHAAPAVVSQR